MAEKRTKRENTNNKNKKRTRKNCNSNKNTNENMKFSDFSYAELIVLAATLAYSLSEELDEDDLAIFIVFLEILVIDMQAIEAQKVIRANKQQPGTSEDINIFE